MNARGLGNVSLGGSGNIRSIVGFSSAFKTINTALDEEDALESTVSDDQVLDSFGKLSAKTNSDDVIPRRGSNTAILLEKDTNKKIVLAWVNRHLLEREMRVRNLSKSFRDGTVLLNLLEVLSGYKIKSFNKKPADKKEIVENMALIQKFLKVLQIDTVFDPDDVMSGDSVAVVQILLKLIDHFKEQTGKQATVNALKSTPRTDSVMDLRADSGILRVFAAKSQENKGRRGVKIDSVAIDIGSSEIAASEHEDPLPPPPSPKETKTSDGSSSPADEAPKKAKTKKPKSPRDGIKLEIKIEPATSDEVTVKPAPIAPEALAPSNAELRPLRRLQSAINRLTVENDEEISFDDLDEALLKQDILDLDSFDIGEADVALSEKPSSEESTDDLLDDLSKMENLLESLSGGVDVDIDVDDL